MNPGLLKSRCVVERPTETQDASGQPEEELVIVAQFRARRIRARASVDPTVEGNREREGRKVIFRRRTTSMQLVKEGDKLRELSSRGVRETLWDITGINPVDGGIYEDLVCENIS